MNHLETELAFCFVCNTSTKHIIVFNKNDEIIRTLCRQCKHKHVVGSNNNV